MPATWKEITAMAVIQFQSNRSICILLLTVLANIAGLDSAASAAPNVYDIKIVEMVGRPGHQGLFPIQGQCDSASTFDWVGK